jgi:hypothetical protein
MRLPAGLVVLAAFGAAACDAPKDRPAAAPQAAQNNPNVIEQIPPNAGDGSIVMLPSGKYCETPAGSVFFTGNDRLCSSFQSATIRVDEALGAPHRRVTMKSVYHQPGPTTDRGDVVSWNENDIRYNCETHELWVVSIVTYGADGSVIMTEAPDRPRKAPTTNPDIGQIVCTPAL